MKEIDPKGIWSRYRVFVFVFGLVIGIFNSFSLLFLNNQLLAAGIQNSVLDNFLAMLIAGLLFESFFDPLTGSLADHYGRKWALQIAFLSAFLSFALLAAVPFMRQNGASVGVLTGAAIL